MQFEIKRNDLHPVLQANLVDKEGAVKDVTGATVRFHMKASRTSTMKVDAAATIVTAASGLVKYTWAAADVDTAGRYEGEFEVTYSDSTIETFPSEGYIQITISEDLA